MSDGSQRRLAEMIAKNPKDLLDLDSKPPVIDDQDETWDAAMNVSSHLLHDHEHDTDGGHVDGHAPARQRPMPVE